jgi:hypothetical protein
MFNIKSNNKVAFFAFIFLLLFLSTTQTDVRIYTLLIIPLLIVIIRFLSDKKIDTLFKKNSIDLIIQKISGIDDKRFFLFLLFILTVLNMIFQGQYLNFETIDSDIHTYLIVGNDVLNGSLPYENQWDDKGPIFYIFYAFLILLSNKNLMIFKILCDFILIFISFMISKIISTQDISNFKINSFVGSSLFLLLLSTPWGSNEYSELFCLFFIAPSIYLLLKKNHSKRNVFLSGLLFGLSTLTNQGSGLFMFVIFVILFQKYKLKITTYFFSGVLIPHIFIFTLYAVRGLLDIYFSTLFIIPLKYSQQSFNFINELLVYFRETFIYNSLLYLFIIFLITLAIYKFIFKEITRNSYFVYVGLSISLLFFYLGSTGYKHHLIFFLFFLCLFIPFLNNLKTFHWLFLSLIISSLIVVGSGALKKSYDNFISLDNIYKEYPLKNLALDIESRFEKDFTIFSLDHNLVLFYLNKRNESFIIHPTNYSEPAIVNELIKINRIKADELPYRISQKPNIVLCSQQIRWLLTDVNCEVTDFYTGYERVDTILYFNNPKRSLYNDSYRSIDLYINNN